MWCLCVLVCVIDYVWLVCGLVSVSCLVGVNVFVLMNYCVLICCGLCIGVCLVYVSDSLVCCVGLVSFWIRLWF